MPWTKITRVESTHWAALRKRPDRCGMGSDRPENAAAAATWAPAGSRFTLVQAIFYILSTGCQWRALPREFPPYSTVQSYFYAWRDTGRWHRIVKALVRQARRKLGRKPRPTAAIIDSQSAATTQAGGPAGFDPGKRIYGRKRHIVTDTNGLLLAVHVHPANVRCPWCRTVAKAPARALSQAEFLPIGSIVANSWSTLSLNADRGTSRSSNDRKAKGFQLLPRRWVVERTFAFGRCRRLAKDFEASPATEVAWLLIAHLRLLTRRLAKP